MNCIIRKIANTENEYLAYIKQYDFYATYFVYFKDSIYGSIQLNNFVEMIKIFFKPKQLKIIVKEKDAVIKNEKILDIIKFG